ncbi:MAG: NAD-dependent epimerase/dehydratase family protein, partial [Myxococcota bacterium]
GDALIAAALAHGAKLVCLDNLYGYGVVDHSAEDTPMHATGRKGRVRAAWDAKLRSTVGLRWAAGRAGDFFGPGTEANSLFSPAMVEGLREGRAAWLLGDATAPHAFGYVPDVIDGLVALATSDATGVWHLPAHTIAPADLVARLADAAGSSARARVVPGWLFHAVAPFVPLFRELRETFYQWDRPFLVDDSRFRGRFPGVGRSLAEAVAETVGTPRERAA